MKKLIAVATFLLACAPLGYLAYTRFTADDLPPLAETAANDPVAFTLPDLDGNPRQISEWAGKSRLINFWATWCAPCRREIPLLKKTQEQHADDNLQVIGVAVDYLEQVTAYAESAQFNYPILVGQEDAMAAAESTGIDFIGLPITMIVSADGYLIRNHVGEIVEDDMTLIVEVFDQMQRGKLDLAGARSALRNL